MDRTLRAFYGFDRIPFGAAADAAPPFLSGFHVALVRGIVDGVRRGDSVTAVRGGRGVGKTTLMHLVAAELRRCGISVIQVASSQQNPEAVQRLIAAAAGLQAAELRKPDELILSLPADQGFGNLVLLFDDADSMSSAMYRYLSLLLTTASFAATKINLVLFGQLGQWAGVAHPDLETLRRATLSSIVIPPLSAADAAAYLAHKAACAGRPLHRVITRKATHDLVAHAQGVPRQLDELADYALWYGHQVGSKRVTRRRLRMALGPEARADAPVRRRAVRSVGTVAASATVMAVAAMAFAWWIGPATKQPPATVIAAAPLATPAPPDRDAEPAPRPVNTPATLAERPSPPAPEMADANAPAARPENPVPPAVTPDEPPSVAADNAPPTGPHPLPQPDPTTARPEQPASAAADAAPSPPRTADASPPAAPVAGRVAVAPAAAPAEPPAPAADTSPPATATADASPAPAPPDLPVANDDRPPAAPLAGPPPAPDLTAARPETQQAVTPAEPPAPPAATSPSDTETADAGPPPGPPTVTQDITAAQQPPSLGAPGLVLIAGAGDSLRGLYAKIYRGVKPPPYAVFAAANRMPVTPGTLVVFPEPPGGWSAR